MSYRIDIMEDKDPVRVGATGTIGSLMFRELESMRKLEQKGNTSTRRALQNDAVSISCGRPLASLAGYRLGTRKNPPPPTQDSNARPRFYDSPVTPRSSNVEGGEWGGRRSGSGGKESNALRGLEPPTCRTRLGFGRQENLPSSEGRRHTDSKALQRKSVSLDGPGGLSAFKGMTMFSDEENPPATPGRPRKERNGEFRTPMLRPDVDEGFHGRRCGWKGVERRRGGGGGGDAPLCASMCSFVEVVDVNCNSSDKIWGSPIASRLRRLSFSRLSESFN